MDAAIEGVPAAPASASYSLWQLVRYMLGLGTYGFGGPVALFGYRYRDLVETRKPDQRPTATRALNRPSNPSPDPT
jgi:hypothetical protein